MAFLTPLALGFLLVLPLVYLAHMLRGSRHRLRVPSTWLWRDLPRDLTERQTRVRLPPLGLLLILQLLAAAAATLGLAELSSYGRAPRHLALVMDASASMQAIDVAPSRFEAARARALERLAQLTSTDIVSLVWAGPQPTLVGSGHPSEVREALVGMRPGGGEGALDAALALAASQLARTPNAAGEIVLLTDGAFPPLAPPDGLGAPVEQVDVGGGAAHQGIVGLQVRPEPAERRQAAYVEVANTEERAVRVRVRVLADGLLLDTRPLDLPPRGRGRLVVELPAETRRVAAELEGRDALALDDAAEVTTAGLEPRRVVLVSQVPASLQRALEADPSLRVSTVSPTDYAPERAPADLTVVDGAAVRKLPPGPLLIVNPASESPLVEVSGTFAAGPLTVFDAEHPLLQGVDAAALRAGRAAQIKPAPWARVVAGTAQGRLVLEGRTEGRPVVVLAADPILSGFDKSIAFPVLVSNAVASLLGDGGLEVRPGDTVSLPAPGGPALLRRPDGQEEPLSAAGAELKVDHTDQVGHYAVVEAGSGHLLSDFSVNLEDAAESDIRPRPAEQHAVAAPPPATRLVTGWWQPLVLAALALLSAEWLVFARRGW
jgi:hypothetical protein